MEMLRSSAIVPGKMGWVLRLARVDLSDERKLFASLAQDDDAFCFISQRSLKGWHRSRRIRFNPYRVGLAFC